jgi:hypothetical protein
MVQSARVQELTTGDDVVLTHQVMEFIAYNAELSRAPVELNAGDVVRFFYPLAPVDETPVQDLLGYVGVPVGSYPTSTFTVPIQGNIAPVPPGLARGTQTFAPGLGQTVRAEVTRLIATVTGNCDGVTGIITDVVSIADVVEGMSVVGAGIPPLSIVISIDPGNFTFTINNNTTSVQVGVNFALGQKQTYYSIDEVDVYARGFPDTLYDTSGGVLPPQSPLRLT